MALLKMSLRSAIFTVLLSISYVTGMTRTADSYENQAASLANVALTNRLESQICSTNAEWYAEGMRISAYMKTLQYWDKNVITWALLNTPLHVLESTIVEGMEFACAKWAEHIPKTFTKVSPYERPDIRITMVPPESAFSSHMEYPAAVRLDKCGVDIKFKDSDIWTTRDSQRRRNIKFFALYEIGHALGMGTTTRPDGVMYGWRSEAAMSRNDPHLTWDDIYGVQRKYGDRNGNFIHGKETFSGRRGEFGI